MERAHFFDPCHGGRAVASSRLGSGSAQEPWSTVARKLVVTEAPAATSGRNSRGDGFFQAEHARPRLDPECVRPRQRWSDGAAERLPEHDPTEQAVIPFQSECRGRAGDSRRPASRLEIGHVEVVVAAGLDAGDLTEVDRATGTKRSKWPRPRRPGSSRAVSGSQSSGEVTIVRAGISRRHPASRNGGPTTQWCPQTKCASSDDSLTTVSSIASVASPARTPEDTLEQKWCQRATASRTALAPRRRRPQAPRAPTATRRPHRETGSPGRGRCTAR